MSPTVQAVLDALQRLGHEARPSGDGWSARCPAHDDTNPSLSIAEGDDGRALLHCHAGCPTEAVCDALGLTLTALMPAQPADQRANGHARNSRAGKGKAHAEPCYPTLEAALAALEARFGKAAQMWEYPNAEGSLVGAVARWNVPGGKEIRPLSRAAGGWRVGAMPAPRPLYNLPAVLTAPADTPVWVCEGEKVADALVRLGLLATTSAGGARAAKHTDWSPLAGRRVVVLPDHDEPGRAYADDVARLCWAAGAPSVRVVDLAQHWADCPDGGDAADLIEAPEGVPWGDAAMPEDVAAWFTRTAEDAPEWQPTAHGAPVSHQQFQPFPIDALPAAVRRFIVEEAEAIGCDRSFVALPALACLAGAIGNAARVVIKRSWSEPAALWCCTVGESGSAKSPAFRAAVAPLHTIQREWLDAYEQAQKDYDRANMAYERDLARWKRSRHDTALPPEKPEPPAARRIVTSDTTIEALAALLKTNPRGVLLARDELSGWVGAFDRYTQGRGGADVAAWLSVYDGNPLVVDRKRDGVLNVPSALVSVCGTIQPGTLARVMTRDLREQGLLARVLLAMPPRGVLLWRDADIDEATQAAYAHVLGRLLALEPTFDDDGRPAPRRLGLSPGARQYFANWHNRHAWRLADRTGDEAAAWAKLKGTAARLALVVELAAWAEGLDFVPPETVGLEAIEAGCRLADWFGAETDRIYAHLDESTADRHGRELAEWIERRGGVVTARDVQAGFRKLREPGDAEAALAELAARGVGFWETTHATGGRPKRCFRLLSAPLCQRNPQNPREKRTFVDVDTASAGCDTAGVGVGGLPDTDGQGTVLWGASGVGLRN